MTITTVGIDLAKNVFAVHSVDQNGKTVLVKPRVSRAALPGLIARLPPYTGSRRLFLWSMAVCDEGVSPACVNIAGLKPQG